jgi:hypothetical protein
MSSVKFRLRGSFLAVLAVGLVWIGCTDNRADLTSPADLGPNILVVDQVALSHALRVQEAYTDEMFEIAGVVGTAVGLSESGRPVVKVYLMTDQVEGVPVNVDGVTFVPEISGEILALQIGQAKGGKGGRPKASVDRTARFDRPVPIGVSTGHPAITAGTIGARVTDGTDVFALSNNHVYAVENWASIGNNVLQPGVFDGGVDPDDAVGTLYDFEPLKFDGSDNVIDAAIASTTTARLGKATPSDGYEVPPSSTIDAAVGQKVKKYGRTTGLTSGQVDAINATVNVGYGTGVARFVHQIIITPGNFSAGGDSGSLILVTTVEGRGKNKKETVDALGLLFAGSPFFTVANPIDTVLNRFQVNIDGN